MDNIEGFSCNGVTLFEGELFHLPHYTILAKLGDAGECVYVLDLSLCYHPFELAYAYVSHRLVHRIDVHGQQGTSQSAQGLYLQVVQSLVVHSGHNNLVIVLHKHRSFIKDGHMSCLPEPTH